MMKTKYSLFLVIYMCLSGLFISCKKSFLEVQPKGIVLESNYYQTPTEALAALTAAYNPLAWESGGSDNTFIDKLGALNSGADECYTGGGGPTDMATWQAFNSYTMSGALGPQAGLWDRNYTGIANANLLLEKIKGVPGLDAATVSRYTAEAQFLRAYYYFDLVREFGNIPLITSPLTSSQIYSQVQTKPDTIYAQIEKDLKASIPNLPSSVVSSENGRVTKGAANALMGKVILTENNTGRMQEAASYFESVNASGVYHLLPNYGSIFDPNNKFNSESIFEVYHSGTSVAQWSTSGPSVLGNIYAQMTGPRSYSGPIFWSGGWSFNPVITAFATFMQGDPRYSATIVNVDSLSKAAAASYAAGYANTGYFMRKFAPLSNEIAKNGQTELNFPNDYIEIRLADTYLMEAEALVRGGGDQSKAQSYLDMVRARVGLSSVPVTLDNIYDERRLELATEGHRWFDLVRTGKAATVLAFKGFKAGVNEVLPIPLVELNNTKLKQNPGYN
jgi:starch-binding outer membrane protein, SusD/RagB family